MPPFGASYHSRVLLMPIYKPICKEQANPVKSVRCWTENNISNLQACFSCFDCTDWDVFYSSCVDFNELVPFPFYVSFCVDSNFPCKEITVFSDNKLWVTNELKNAMNMKKHIFYTGNTQEKTEINKVVSNYNNEN